MSIRVMLCTLLLNEMEWLPRIYSQHKDWEGLCCWAFIEAADIVYARSNPGLVSRCGLSTDGTTDFLRQLAASDPRVIYRPFGTTSDPDPGQGKRPARQAYLDIAEEVKPDYICVLDGDELFTKEAQGQLNRLVANRPNLNAFQIRYRNIWRPLSIAAQPLFAREVIGGVWGVPHCHFWRWQPGLRHETHVRVAAKTGEQLLRRSWLPTKGDGFPECIHMAFASDLKLRQAKHAYYGSRGEDADPKRRWYQECRAAYEVWKPGDILPHGARVIRYTGPVPEIFKEQPNE